VTSRSGHFRHDCGLGGKGDFYILTRLKSLSVNS